MLSQHEVENSPEYSAISNFAVVLYFTELRVPRIQVPNELPGFFVPVWSVRDPGSLTRIQVSCLLLVSQSRRRRRRVQEASAKDSSDRKTPLDEQRQAVALCQLVGGSISLTSTLIGVHHENRCASR